MSKLPKTTNLNFGIIAPAAAILVIIGVAGYQFIDRGGLKKVDGVDDACTTRSFAEIGGPFELVNQDNVKFTDKDLLGKPALLYFGYTYCPDVCPTSLTYMGAAMNALEEQDPKLRKEIQTVFITIDPARDTPKKMKEYIVSGGFPSGLIGLSGSEEQINKAAKEYKVGFKKVVPPNAAPEDYVMDHTSIIYMLDRKGKLATFFSDQTNPKKMAQCIAVLDKDSKH